MKAQYIKRTGSDTLTLFFAGWGMDSVPFADHTGGGDLLLLYDYTDLTFDTELTDGYRHYRVAAVDGGVGGIVRGSRVRFGYFRKCGCGRYFHPCIGAFRHTARHIRRYSRRPKR